jgi:hypothetical protein
MTRMWTVNCANVSVPMFLFLFVVILAICGSTVAKVRSQFFTDKPIFIYIRANSNIYWFIGIWICCQRIQTKSYSFTLDYL